MKPPRMIVPTILCLGLAVSHVACGGGSSATATVPGKPVISNFAASPASVAAGASATLSWNVSSATSLQLSGVSSVSGNSIVVTPAQSTTYTLSATNAAGTTTQSVNVTVTGTSIFASILIDPSKPGLGIPKSFVGFSHEWGNAQTLMGSPSSGVNSIYRQLLKNLMANGNRPFLIRVGGNSTDKTTAPTPGVVDAFAQLYKDIGAQFTLGVNLGSNDVSLARQQTTAYVAGMPAGSLLAIEIGNEPDLYGSNGYRTSPYPTQNIFPISRPGELPCCPSWLVASN